MPDQLVHFKASPLARILMLLSILLALAASWFVLRWYLGNTIAEYFNPDDARIETARMAVSLAPGDPLTHWRLGDFIYTRLPPDQVAQAAAEFEMAVSLSPNDYRYWTSWGQALEHAGEYAKAESALREAVRLAPSYYFPRWHLGNLLLRQNRYDEAFGELRQASEANELLKPQLFNIAWQVNRDDVDAMRAAIGNAAATRAEFSLYLAKRSRFDDSLKVWHSLTESEKKEARPVAEALIDTLTASKQFHTAAGIWNEVAPGELYRAQPGKIIDPGFDSQITHGPTYAFGWQVPSSSQLQIGITTNTGHNSDRSLRLFFQVRSNLDPISVAQLVLVHPNTQYELECFVRTEDLVGASTPAIVIFDASTDSRLVSSPQSPTGNTDWQPIAVSFKSGPKTEAIVVKIERAPCEADNPVCPIFGTVWYDDFNLKSTK
jgi:tetratricopeptide (TPR) repeat protein